MIKQKGTVNQIGMRKFQGRKNILNQQQKDRQETIR